MKISVITAVYNAEKTVGHAIQSVASQTYPDIEHIVVDGASTDSSLSVIKENMKDGTRLISEPDNGIYDALNKGISHATGDVIGFLHSDDFFSDETALSTVGKAFSERDVDAVFSNLDYVSQTDTSKVIRHWNTGDYSLPKLKRGWMPAHPTLYLRKSIYDNIGAFDTTFGISADYDFVLRYFSQGSVKCSYVPEVLYKMRVGGVSNRNLEKILQKMREDYRAVRRNKIGGMGTLTWKNMSKLTQFVKKSS